MSEVPLQAGALTRFAGHSARVARVCWVARGTPPEPRNPKFGNQNPNPGTRTPELPETRELNPEPEIFQGSGWSRWRGATPSCSSGGYPELPIPEIRYPKPDTRSPHSSAK